MATDRLTWKQSEYGLLGWAGSIRLFGIHYRMRKSDPVYYLMSELPGFTKQRWKDDSRDALKLMAERVLSKWLEETGCLDVTFVVDKRLPSALRCT